MSFKRVQTYASNPNTTRGQAVHLGGDPKGNNVLYTNGRSVIIRNLKNPEIATEYTGHSCNATVARYSPSGFYIASDVQGNIRIWDTVGSENIIKTETKVFSGKINDLDWDFESKRLVAVGEGKDKFGHAFLFDSASSVGEISGHSKVINSVSLNKSRPFRAVTGSDDCSVNFYHGVPFKFNKSISDHGRFVQCVRFSPDGNFFATVGMDQRIFLYDGKSGDKVKELSLSKDTHTGGIFSVSWSPDSKNILTHSADTTVKLWDVEASSVISTYQFSDTLGKIEDQQVGGLWQGDFMLSLSLSGDFNYLDKNKPGKPTRVVKGHQKAITALATSEDRKTIYTGSYDGKIYAWDNGNTKDCISIEGGGHKNQITALCVNENKIFSAGMDDCLKIIDEKTKSFGPLNFSTGSIPKSIASKEDLVLISTLKQELILTNLKGEKVFSQSVKYTPTSVSISPKGYQVAVGADDNKVYLYELKGNSLVDLNTTLDSKAPVTSVSYSPDSSLLAVTDSSKNILVFDVATKQVKISQWVFHNARVNSFSWSPDGQHAASGSLDTNVEIWSVENPMKHISIKGAHLEGVTGVVWLDNQTVASTGQDCMLKVWSLTHHK
ncbi:hypothetical protein HK099_004778 [Clydaea vesicula]|uniref:Uncharacterized protein n=1 Tax=Clydaea vesicula TaxID=447962 RepID=A0AAD5Y013_9FUNG|nr:hypothetical protein HK099_004778 [Clydaea vesicula]